MHSEAGNIGHLVKHLVKCLARGRIREASACVIVIGWRLVEAAGEMGGSQVVTCQLCGWSGRRFKTVLAGPYHRRGAVCPRCLSLERHREFIVLFRRLRPLLGARIRLLDIAPTGAFAEVCRASPDVTYVSIDKVSRLALARMDVQQLALAGDAFDVVVCCHVLDYVTEDRAAMREIRRVLKRGGVAILQESIDGSRPTEEWFGPRPEKLNRIRQYGVDFSQRLRDAGLVVRRSGTGRGEVFLAFKEAGAESVTAFEKAAAS